MLSVLIKLIWYVMIATGLLMLVATAPWFITVILVALLTGLYYLTKLAWRSK
jgi:threonine/homoserine/homoserine lactone efflux protein